jgi:hypothetical protein
VEAEGKGGHHKFIRKHLATSYSDASTELNTARRVFLRLVDIPTNNSNFDHLLKIFDHM